MFITTISRKPASVVEIILDVFKDCNWNPITITMPQNGDHITLTPLFYKGCQEKSASTFHILKVTGSVMPISGTISHVVHELQHYDELIELRRQLDAHYRDNPTTPEEIALYAFETA